MCYLFTSVFNMLLPGSIITSLWVFFSHMDLKVKLCSWTQLITGQIPCQNDKWHSLRKFFKLTAPRVDFHIDRKAQSHYYDNIFEGIFEVFPIFPKLNRQEYKQDHSDRYNICALLSNVGLTQPSHWLNVHHAWIKNGTLRSVKREQNIPSETISSW